MRLLQSLLLAACLIYGVVSSPTPTTHQNKGRSFKVERVRRGHDVHGPSALNSAYQKFGITPTFFGIDLLDFEPTTVKKHATSSSAVPEPDQTGAVSAKSVEGDAQFVSPVTIGEQQIVMNFDTGSADFWVMNSQLPESARVGRTVYNPSKSTTFQEMDGSTFNISYGDASYAYGNVGTDKVTIGGATVTRQAIGLPTEVSSSFSSNRFTNGLVGLGFSTLNTIQPNKQKTFLENIASSLEEPVLTASLKSDGVGEYEFGVVDKSKYTGDLARVEIDSSNGFWEFESAYYSVGDNGTLNELHDAATAIADTGTSLMLLEQEVVDAYYDQVEGAVFANSAGGYIYPCASKLPSLTVAIGPDSLATIPGHLIEFAEIGNNRTTGDTLCYGGVQSNQGSAMQIFGDVFLKAFFVVFDMRGPSLGVGSPKWS